MSGDPRLVRHEYGFLQVREPPGPEALAFYRAMAEVGLGRSLTAFLTPSPLSAC